MPVQLLELYIYIYTGTLMYFVCSNSVRLKSWNSVLTYGYLTLVACIQAYRGVEL